MGFVRFQLFLLFLIAAMTCYYYMSGYAAEIAKLRTQAHGAVARSTADTFRTMETSEAYDRNGNVISVLKGEKDVYYITADEIPTYAKQAIVSIEDKKFYSHHGVDYKAIIRAVIAMLQDGEITQGASTITQQLARNIFLTQDRTWERKIEELYIASELEKKYSKDQILEFYLNNIYFANGYYGLEAASRGYFGCSASELSLSQQAFLLAIPNSPSNYDPRLHFNNTIDRRNRILKNMLEDRVISVTNYQMAIDEIIYLEQPEQVYNNYAETYMFYCATRALMELDGFEFRSDFITDDEKAAYEADYDEEYTRCNAMLYTGGYRIYTTLDMEMQEYLQQCVDERLSDYDEVNEEGVYALQAAATCIDNETGDVRAIVGGRTQEVAPYTLNRAYQSFRQPGSTIKPLIVYTPALAAGYTPDTIVVDEPIEGGPANAERAYEGEMTLRRAVEKSKNTIAYKIFEELTPVYGLSFLHLMNFSHIKKSDEVLPAALGGLTEGVSTLEMAKAFETIENDGIFREASCIDRIEDADGNILYQNNRAETVVYDSEACRMMTDILKGVLTNGTGRGLGLGDIPCAAKTGTTNENKDGWFVGYTRYYTTAVWVGYDIPRPMKNVTGGTYPGQIWQRFMKQIHKGLQISEFIAPTTYTPIDEEGETEKTHELTDEEVDEILNRPGETIQDIMGDGYDENGNLIEADDGNDDPEKAETRDTGEAEEGETIQTENYDPEAEP